MDARSGDFLFDAIDSRTDNRNNYLDFWKRYGFFESNPIFNIAMVSVILSAIIPTLIVKKFIPNEKIPKANDNQNIL
jgi:lipoprotein signal peptidase